MDDTHPCVIGGHTFGDVSTHDGRWVCTRCGFTDEPELPDDCELYADDYCAMCGSPAEDVYEGYPSCGRPSCELRMQKAIDDHDECGHR